MKNTERWGKIRDKGQGIRDKGLWDVWDRLVNG
jgi:hypothetical protein